MKIVLNNKVQMGGQKKNSLNFSNEQEYLFFI